jgi:hypothetical protein
MNWVAISALVFVINGGAALSNTVVVSQFATS